MKLLVSRHAEEEMVRRQIPPEWLEAVLENPQQRVAQPGGKEILQSRVKSQHGKMYLLMVVAADKEPPVGVTVYRTNKIAKY